MLVLLAALAAPANAQPKPPAETVTLDSISPSQRPLVRARAQHCYRMPDGTIWDGWAYFEQRKIIGYAIKAFDQVEPGHANPGQTLIEDRVVGTVWRVKPSREALAWGLSEQLGGHDGDITQGRFERSDRRRWVDAPPLWYSPAAQDYTWPFAYVDESEPDDFTRLTHGGYLEITRDWGDGRYDFKGYSLDRGTLQGVVTVADPARFIKKDRFKGAFFLWPEDAKATTPTARTSWRLIPADEIRTTPDQLAEALLTGAAQVIDWRFDMIREKVVWRRVIHRVEPARERPIVAAAAPTKPAITPPGGPDLLVLNDGRWFRGTITRRDEKAVIIRTFIGQSEMEMTFKPEEVKEIQAPEKRDSAPDRH
jgi:hypothetical protein